MKNMKRLIVALLIGIVSMSNVAFGQTSSFGPGGVGSYYTDPLLWYRADDISSSAYTNWNNKNHPFSHLTSSSKPTLNAADVYFNNRKSLTFDASQSHFLTESVSIPTFDLTPLHIFLAYNPNNPYASPAIEMGLLQLYSSTDVNTKLDVGFFQTTLDYRFELEGDIDESDEAGLVADQTTQVLHLRLFWEQASGNKIDLTIEGQLNNGGSQSRTLTVDEASQVLDRLQIGTGFLGDFDGEISEFIMYSEDLNEGQVGIISNYLASKYDVALTNDFYNYDDPNGSIDYYGYDLAGICAGSDGDHLSAESAEIKVTGEIGDFNFSSNYFLFGHDNAVLTFSPETSEDLITEKMNRTWHTDASFTTLATEQTLSVEIGRSDLESVITNKVFVMLVSDNESFTDFDIVMPSSLETVSMKYDYAFEEDQFITFGVLNLTACDGYGFGEDAIYRSGGGTKQVAFSGDAYVNVNDVNEIKLKIVGHDNGSLTSSIAHAERNIKFLERSWCVSSIDHDDFNFRPNVDFGIKKSVLEAFHTLEYNQGYALFVEKDGYFETASAEIRKLQISSINGEEYYVANQRIYDNVKFTFGVYHINDCGSNNLSEDGIAALANYVPYLGVGNLQLRTTGEQSSPLEEHEFVMVSHLVNNSGSFNASTGNTRGIEISSEEWCAQLSAFQFLRTFKVTVDDNSLDDLYPLEDHERAVIITDDDGDFTTGSSFVAMAEWEEPSSGDEDFYYGQLPLRDHERIRYGVLFNFDDAMAAGFDQEIVTLGQTDLGYHESSMTSSVLTIGFPSDQQPHEYAIAGHDAGALSFTANTPVSGYDQLGRLWRAKVLGDIGAFDVELNASSLTGSGSDFVLFIDRNHDNDFDDPEDLIIPMIPGSGNKWLSFGTDIQDGDVISVGTTTLTPTVITASEFECSHSILAVNEACDLYPEDELSVNYSLPCTKEVVNAFVKVTLSTGEMHNLGDSPFDAQVMISVIGYSDFTEVTTNAELFRVDGIPMEIDQDKPEELLVHHVTEYYPSLKRIRVVIDAVTDIDNIAVLETELHEDSKTFVPTLSTEPIVQVTTKPVTNGTTHFEWELISNVQGFCNPPTYQIQILRLYDLNETDDVDYLVNWSEATTIETKETSIDFMLAEGTGSYVWRVRPIGDYFEGGTGNSQNWGMWSGTGIMTNGAHIVTGYLQASSQYPKPYFFSYTQFDEDKNFIYSRVITEETRIRESASYANGLQQVKQSQTHLSSNNEGEVIVSQSVYDFSGRPSLNSLAAPALDGQEYLGYREGVLKDVNGDLYRDKHFDDDANYKDPTPTDDGIINNYYSDLNEDLTIPSAEGYPFSRTLFKTDGSGRPIEEGVAGNTLRIGQDHTLRVEFGAVTDAELVQLFGREAPDKGSVYKTITTDQNDITTVAIINKSGQTIATMIVDKDEVTNLQPLDSEIGQPLSFVEVLDENVPYGENGFQASYPLVLSAETDITVEQELTPTIIESLCGEYCTTCGYKVTVSLTYMGVDPPAGFTNQTLTSTITAGQTIKASGSCTSALEEMTIPVFQDVPAGSYLLERIIETDATGASAYVDGMANKLKTEIEEIFSPVQSAIDNGDAEGTMNAALNLLTTYELNPDITITLWDGIGDEVTDYSNLTIEDIDGHELQVVTTCCEIRVPLAVPEYKICEDLLVTDTEIATYFGDEFVEFMNGSTDNETGVFSDYIPNDSEFGDYNQTTFESLIYNMLQEPEYECQQLWDCWSGTYFVAERTDNTGDFETDVDAIVDNEDNEFGDLGNALNDDRPNADELYSADDFIYNFLVCSQFHFEGFFESPLSNAQKGLVYKYFVYNDREMTDRGLKSTDGFDCEKMLCNWGPISDDQVNFYSSADHPFDDFMCASSLPACDLNFVNGPDYSASFDCISLEFPNNPNIVWTEREYINLAGCVRNSFELTNTDSDELAELLLQEMLQDKEEMETRCKNKCESDNMFNDFRSDVEELFFDANTSTYIGMNANTMEEEDICCTALGLVEECVEQCHLTLITKDCNNDPLYPKDVIIPIALGTPEEKDVVNAILMGTFEIEKHDAGGSCGSDFDLVEPRADIETPWQCRNEVPITGENHRFFAGGAASSVALLPVAGGYILVANAPSGVGHDKTDPGFGDEDVWILKLDEDYNIINQKCFGGSNRDVVFRACLTENGGLFLTGSTSSPNVGDLTNRISVSNSHEAWMFAISVDDLSVTWQRTVVDRGPWDVVRDGDHLILVGIADMVSGQYHKAMIMKISGSDGQTIWEKVVPVPGSAFPNFSNVVLANDGGYIVCGKKIWAYAYSNGDSWMVHFDEDGNEVNSLVEPLNYENLVATSYGYALYVRDADEHSLVPYRIRRYNNDLLFLGEATYGSNNSYHHGQSIMVNYEGETILLSTTIEQSTHSAKTEPGRGGVDFWAIVVDDYGNVLRDKTLGSSSIDNLFGNGKYSLLRFDSKKYLVLRTVLGNGGDVTETSNLGYEGLWLCEFGWGLNTACQAEKLCLKWIPGLNTTITVDPIDPEGPEDINTRIVNTTGTAISSALAQCTIKKEQELRDEYFSVCFGSELVEKTTVSYELDQHHYTLYYYDRAGNLVQTVPPAGVRADKTDRNDIDEDGLQTKYRYNSLGQLVEQSTPDGGTTKFIYDYLGRLRFSQNAEQAKVENNDFSYTRYDELGRIFEVGVTDLPENKTFADLDDDYYLGGHTFTFGYPGVEVTHLYTGELSFPLHTDEITSAPFPRSDTRERTLTVYTDKADVNFLKMDLNLGLWQEFEQRYLRNRVSHTYTDTDGDQTTVNDQTHTYYSYDPHGNVEWLIQDLPGLGKSYISYEYDLISGNVLRVNYNQGFDDQFFHKYSYDADNRILAVETSTDGYLWEQDAHYDYYAHGPLRRTEIGEDKVQGLDYIYTIQGWLKGINHPEIYGYHHLTEGYRVPDPSADGKKGNKVARDAFGMKLAYFKGDFEKTGSDWSSTAWLDQHNVESYQSGTSYRPNELFNGNISSIAERTEDMGTGYNRYGHETQYTYDYLNRLTGSVLKKRSNGTNPGEPAYYKSIGNSFRTKYTYDANGNIKTLDRWGYPYDAFDQLTYHYDEANGKSNQLLYLTEPWQLSGMINGDIDAPDLSNNGNEPWDHKNYEYDEIGNLTRDISELSEIEWTVYGKVKSVKKYSSFNFTTREFEGLVSSLTFNYDASGNRVSKTMAPVVGETLETFYMRDASGNPMATYSVEDDQGVKSLRLKEQSIYGSDRLGLQTPVDEGIDHYSLNVNIGDLQIVEVVHDTKVNQNPYADRAESFGLYVLLYNNSDKIIDLDKVQMFVTAQGGLPTLKPKLIGAGDLLPGHYLVVAPNPDQDALHNEPTPLCQSDRVENFLAINGLDLANAERTDIKWFWVNDFHLAQLFGQVYVKYKNQIGVYQKVDRVGWHDGHSSYAQRALNVSSLDPCDGIVHNAIRRIDYDLSTTDINRSHWTTGPATLDWKVPRHNIHTRKLDGRMYELKDHLGNVRVVVSDRVLNKRTDMSDEFEGFEDPLNSGEQVYAGEHSYKLDADVVNTLTSTIELEVFEGDLIEAGAWVYFDELDNVSNASKLVIQVVDESDNSLAVNESVDVTIGTAEQAWSVLFKGGLTVPDQVGPYTMKVFVEHSSTDTDPIWVDNMFLHVDHQKQSGNSVGEYQLTADVVSFTNYYPFGWEQPGRKYNSGDYRYGFNGMEKDDEVAGKGASYTATYWQYDSRLGRRWNQDPVNKSGLSPYLTFGNNPVLFVDPNGDDWFSINGKFVWKDQRGDFKDNDGTTYKSLGTSIKIVTKSEIESNVEFPWEADPKDPTGVKLETQVTLTGNYDGDGDFDGFTATISREPHSSFENTEGYNSEYEGTPKADGIKNIPSGNTGSFSLGQNFSVLRSTQAPDRWIGMINPALYLEQVGGGNPKVVQGLIIKVSSQTGELGITYLHGPTPSVHSTVNNTPFYNFKSHSYSLYEFPDLKRQHTFDILEYENETRPPIQNEYEKTNKGTNGNDY